MAISERNLSAFLDFDDPREVPAYSIRDAAHYLGIPNATLRSWVRGTTYTTSSGERRQFRRVIDLPQKDCNLLSFFNLVEAHVLRGLRTQHRVKLQDVRKALDFVKRKSGWARPLIQQQFKTDGVKLFIERYGTLLEASADGQMIMRQVLEAHLKRVQWEGNVAAALFPFTRQGIEEPHSPKTVMIDPRFCFGRPILRDSRVPTAVIAERYKAGDSIDHLAHDYGCSREEIEEGVRCELQTAA